MSSRRTIVVALAAGSMLLAAACSSKASAPTPIPRVSGTSAATAPAVATAPAAATATPSPAALPPGPYTSSPWWPYLSAHVNDRHPLDVLGGPITVKASQPEGSVNWILPGPRELDPAVFGTANDPSHTDGPPLLVGVPVAMRTTGADGKQVTTVATPFSDKSAPIKGSFEMTVVDATSTDAAVTKDTIDFKATFTSPDGKHTYQVVVKRASPHGWFAPTAGGVATNIIQHGVTDWGTPLMPTEYDDVAFWGPGDLLKDGKVIAHDRPVHVMLTEFVRGPGYKLVEDAGVNPDARHLHLFIAPFDALGNPSPVPTGFTLPNGQQQPFLHIMFPAVTASATRGSTFTGEVPASSGSTGTASGGAALPNGPYQTSPWWSYLSAHVHDRHPLDVLGGAFAAQVSQPEGSVNWILPGQRELEPAVFGTADAPKTTAGPPLLVGIPTAIRESKDGKQFTKPMTPFSDSSAPVKGSFEMTVVDATSTDAAVTKDQVDFKATFTSPDGKHTYQVVVKKALPHGWFAPTAGGVITNFIQHGVTDWGSPLMPTEYDDIAFWGPGDLLEDGKVIAHNRPVHVMLTEFVRGPGYKLVDDAGVNPDARHLHLFLAPFDALGNPSPVPTGFTLPNGQQQPFLHIMFPAPHVDSAGTVTGS